MSARSPVRQRPRFKLPGLPAKKLRRLNVATHRDLGYFCAGLVIIYCLSGLALNHVDDWNPDFIIHRKTIHFTGEYRADSLSGESIAAFGSMVGEGKYKVYDMPAPAQLKIYYDNASLHLNFSTHTGVYEQIARRPLFYQVNLLHRNSLKGWRWASDVLAVMLVVISVSGLFILKGKKGLSGRGKWLLLAGLLPPVMAWIAAALGWL